MKRLKQTVAVGLIAIMLIASVQRTAHSFGGAAIAIGAIMSAIQTFANMTTAAVANAHKEIMQQGMQNRQRMKKNDQNRAADVRKDAVLRAVQRAKSQYKSGSFTGFCQAVEEGGERAASTANQESLSYKYRTGADSLTETINQQPGRQTEETLKAPETKEFATDLPDSDDANLRNNVTKISLATNIDAVTNPPESALKTPEGAKFRETQKKKQMMLKGPKDALSDVMALEQGGGGVNAMFDNLQNKVHSFYASGPKLSEVSAKNEAGLLKKLVKQTGVQNKLLLEMLRMLKHNVVVNAESTSVDLNSYFNPRLRNRKQATTGGSP